MIVQTNYEVGDLVLTKGSQDYWKVIAIHISLHNKSTGIHYDIQSRCGKRIVIQEPGIIKRVI